MQHTWHLWRALSLLCACLATMPLTAAAPVRIVSTSPSTTETLFALGLGARVVGVSEYCRYPLEARDLPKVGTFLRPDAERIAGLRPDLVVLHSTGNGIDRRLSALGIPFVVADRGTMAGVFAMIRTIAKAARVVDRGEALVVELQSRLAGIRRGAAARPQRRVLFIVGRRLGSLTDLVGVGRESYLNELIEAAGGINVLATGGLPEYPRISMETVLRLDPDVIIDTVDMGETDAERRQRQPVNERLWLAYPTLTAVKSSRVYAATTDALVVPGPRMVDAAEWLAALIGAERPR